MKKYKVIDNQREYNSYTNMKGRCYSTKKDNYHRYGGRGIRVCDRWLESFDNFMDDMGAKPTPKHEIDRIDVNGDYTPENCRWITSKENRRNRRTSRFIEFNGEVWYISALAEKYNMKNPTLHKRLKLGWSIEKALETPVKEK